MTFDEFATNVFYEKIAPGIRPGQHAFNYLSEVRGDLADGLTGSLYDPFCNDENLPACWLWLENHWND